MVIFCAIETFDWDGNRVPSLEAETKFFLSDEEAKAWVKQRRSDLSYEYEAEGMVYEGDFEIFCDEVMGS